MNVPPNNSVFWVVLRQVLLCVLLCSVAAFAYKNKMSSTDIMPILITMGGVFGFDLTKKALTTPPPEDKD